MRTLLWKEFRETWKWGVLLLVASAIGHVSMQVGNERHVVLFTHDYLGFSMFGFALGALLLGVLQTVFEAQRDRWAYLRHRAITPERILLAKAIVGLSLYFVAVLIPLLLLAIWESIPGHVPAPFHWSAPVTGVTMMFAGAAYWFAGALIGVRDVRWYGTRLLPVGLPIAGTAGMVIILGSIGLPSTAGFCAAFCVFAATLSPMVIATAGAFRNRTGYLNQTRGSRWCLALSSACSLWLLTLPALMIVAGTLEDLRLLWMWPSRAVIHEIDRQGRLIRLEWEVNPLDPYDRSLHDHGLTVVDSGRGVDPRVSLSDLVRFVSLGHGRSNGQFPRVLRRGFGEDGPFRRLWRPSPRPGQIHWFYDSEDGVLLGYHERTRRLAWRAGPDGIVLADQPVTRRFPGAPVDSIIISRIERTGFVAARKQAGESLEHIKSALDWTFSLRFEDGLYLLDPDSPRLTLAYAVEPPARLIDVAVNQSSDESVMWMVRDQMIRKLALTEGDRVLVATDSSGRHQLTEDLLRAEFTIPDALQGIGHFGFAELPDKNLVVYRVPQTDSALRQTKVNHLLLATPQGRILRHVVSDSEQYFHHRAVLFAAPMLPAIPATILTTWLSPEIVPLSIPGVAVESVTLPPSPMFSIVMWVSALLSLLVTGLLTRRWRFSRTSSLGWLAATVALGPAGPLTLLVLRERVVNVTCSGCQSLRPRTSERCPQCGQLFAEPARNGTEIYLTLAESKPAQSLAESITR